MSNRPETGRVPLSIETDLDLRFGDRPVDVASTGERVFVDVPSVRTAYRILKEGLPVDRSRAAALLRATDLTVEVRVRGATVLVFGADARPGPLSREAGVAPGELRVGGVAAAVGREGVAGGRWVRRRLD